MSSAKTKLLQSFFYTELGKAFLNYDPVSDQVKFIKAATIESDGVWHYLANWRSKEEAFKQLQNLFLGMTELDQQCHVILEKGSKLRKHMMNMVAMNNIMRAFIYNYDMDVDCKTIQEKLLQTVLTVEARRDRKFLIADIEVLKEAVEKYDALLFSATEEIPIPL